jgi:hypothetical protein
MSDGTQLVRYDAMCHAIAAAHAVDEVKDIRDKAMALEHYARQARNTEAERQACEIRLRAERKCGEILSGREMSKGAAQPGVGRRGADAMPSTDTMALGALGISHDQSSQWQKLAAIPADQFEADLADAMWRPTTSGLLERADARERGPLPALKGDDDALWLWGTLIDFDEHGRLGRDPHELMSTPMHDHMRQTLYELAPKVAAWLGRIKR